MHIAYVDESGDTGPRAEGGSMTYVLGCVMIEGTAWPTTFDAMIDFRRDLRDEFDLPVRTEVKANWLLHGRGPLRPLKLADVERAAIHRLLKAGPEGQARWHGRQHVRVWHPSLSQGEHRDVAPCWPRMWG